jgi:glycosyltransferase involved in cell wall biosynthesis
MAELRHRIAFFSLQNAAPWGGSEELWSQTACRLIDRGHQVMATVFRWPRAVKQIHELAARGCELHTFDYRPTLIERIRGRLGFAQGVPFEWLDKPRPTLTVISVIGHDCGLLEMQACRARGIPYLLIVQAASESSWPGDDQLDRLYAALTQAVAVCFVSEANRRLVERQFGRPLPNARVVRNPFNVSYASEPSWPDARVGFRLACVGRLDPSHKGQDVIIDLLGQAKWRERQLSISLIGRGWCERGLRQLAQWRKANVHFLGFTDNIEAVWADHHGLILPSRAEGLPLAIVEAMLCRRMAVVTNVAGNAEMIEDGRTGFVALAPTVDLLDEALERAWVRRDDWQSLGIEAGRRVRELVPPDPAAAFADIVEATAGAVAA